MQKKKFKLLGPLICLLTAMIWGSGFPFQDMVGQDTQNIDNFSFNGIRFLIGGIVLIPVFLIFERKKEQLPKAEKTKKLKSTLIFGAISGALLSVSAVLQQAGIQLTGESGKAGFITGFYLIILPVAMLILFKQKPSIFVWIAIPISLLGLYFLFEQKDECVFSCSLSIHNYTVLNNLN